MQRITITLDESLLAEVDAAIAARGYQNRSEAIRDFTRIGLLHGSHASGGEADCVAAVVYVYDHEVRDMSRRLVKGFHAHHNLTLATLHVHLDDDNCLELSALKGKTAEVKHFAEHIIAERGIRYGQLVMIPMEMGKATKRR